MQWEKSYTYKGILILMTVFSSEAIEAKRKPYIIKFWKNRIINCEFYNHQNYLLEIKRNKRSPDEGKVNRFVTSSTSLKNWLMDVIETESHW